MHSSSFLWFFRLTLKNFRVVLYFTNMLEVLNFILPMSECSGMRFNRATHLWRWDRTIYQEFYGQTELQEMKVGHLLLEELLEHGRVRLSRGGGGRTPHKFRLPGAQTFEGLSPTSDNRGVPSFPPGQRRLDPFPNTPPGLTVLGGSQHLGVRATLPGDPSPSVSLDGCLSLGMGRTTPSPCHRSRPLGATGGSPPHKCARALGGQPGHHNLQPVVLSPCRVYVQRDGSVRVNAPPHSLPPVTGGSERSLTRHGQATGFYSTAPHPHHPQCGGGRPEPARTAQHGVDAASRGLPSDSSLGRSPTSRSPGLSDQLPSSAVSLPLPSSGCSGLQLSKFQLERLRQHLCVPTGRTNPNSAALIRGYRGRLVLVDPWDPHAPWLPFLLQQARDHLHLWTTPFQFCGRGQVFHRLGTFARWTAFLFLRRALLTSRPAAVVNTLLASYRPSSQRQQEVAWNAFRRWLPQDRSTVTKDDVLAFLQDLFSTRSLAPTTILNYRAALQWPLEEAFSVDFSHSDFSRFATGLFHLRPPVTPEVPQWNLSAVVRFYEQVDHHTCSPRLLLFKTHCFTALASGNRCSELAHISRRAIVEITKGRLFRYPFSLVFYLKTKRRLAVPLLFLLFISLPFPILLSVLSRLRVFLCRTATWNHLDYLFVNPVSHASLVASRINYWLVQAILAANVGNSVVRAHDVRKFAFSINWACRADMSHIIKHGFWSSVHPFLINYLTPLEGSLPGCIAAGSRI